MDVKNILPKRPRGRPRGTGIDDVATLAVVADMLATHPSMKPTTAMKRCVTRIQSSHLRRLQEKWRVDGPRLRIEAVKRARQKKDARTVAEIATALRGARELGQWCNTVLVPIITPAMQTIRDAARSMGELGQLGGSTIASTVTPAMEAALRDVARSMNDLSVGSPISALMTSIATQVTREPQGMAERFNPLMR